MKKKIISFVLALALIISVVPLNGAASAYAEETLSMTSAREIKGDGWKLSETGVFTLFKDIKWQDDKPYQWEQYAEQIKEVRVAEGVTEIPAIAFASKYINLRKVTMASTVKVIDNSAFVNNKNLVEVNLNEGLESVGVTAFSNTGITSIKLPKGVTWYSDVFTDCKNLSGTVVIPSGTKWAGNAQLYGTAVETVIIEDGVKQVPNQLLSGCDNLKYVWLAKSLPDNAFDIGNGGWDSPIPACCIIGYKGSVAEKYVNHWLGVGSDWTKGMKFHAIDGDDHAFGQWQIIKNPTCTQQGMRKHRCTICNVERSEAMPITHTWNNYYTIDKAPTLTTSGKKSIHCKKCSAVKNSTTVSRLMLVAPLSVKSRLSNRSGGYDDINVYWSKVKNAKGYYVYYRNRSKTTKWSYLLRTTKTSLTKKNLADGAKYEFKVVPYYEKSKVKYKSTNYKTTAIYTLKKVPISKVKKYGKNKVMVSWKDIPGQKGYQISRSTSKKQTKIVGTYKTTSAKSKVVKAVRKKGYYYKIRSFTYIKIGSKTYRVYGPWSQVKYFKLK